VHGALGGIIVATVRTEGTAFPADDFKLGTQREVDSLFWQGGYFQCQLAQGQMDYHWDWRILFWSDDGTGNHPGSEIYNQTIPDASIAREHWYDYTHPTNGNTYWVANYSTQLPVPITFNANTKYWITIQGIQIPNAAPQACWSRHNNTVGGIKLHEAVIKAAWWSYPDWTNISVLVADHLPHDLNYQLLGPGVNNPPEAPSFTGPTKGKPNVDYDFTLNAVDPDGDDVSYFIDWGDGTTTGWTSTYASGTDVIVNHTWTTKGTYAVKAKAKDINNAESDWATLTFKVPRIITIKDWFQQFFEQFPHAFPVLRHLLGL
jgi:uncharacterized protein YceK